MLVIFSSIAVLGVATFVIQSLARNPVLDTQSKCAYLAQAGIQNALYYFRLHDKSGNGYFSLGRTDIDADNFFVLEATAVGLLMVDTNSSTLQNQSRYVNNWVIQNATNSQTITISSMTVSWTGVPANRMLQQIRLGNSQRWPPGGGNGAAVSGTNCDINDFTLNTTPQRYSNNSLRFNNGMSGGEIKVEFFMSDGTSKIITVYPASSNNIFTLKSTGKTSGSNIYRSIQADYNARSSRITDYHEVSAQVTP